MAIQAKKQSPWFILLLIAASVAIWAIDQRGGSKIPEKEESSRPAREKSSAPANSTDLIKPRDPRQKIEKQGDYEVYRGCTLVTHKNNDADSFLVRLPDGREAILRLYYVDSPESAFKTYRGGADNRDRINDQARDFGNISAERAVEVGKLAKEFTLDRLGKAPFTIFTEWDSPFNDQRYHAFVQVSSGGNPQWLHEQLLQNGLARLKTKPAPLPDGTSVENHRRTLETARRHAIRMKLGAWDR
jgi:endonuclease YncB( thermonuclease family)